MKKHDVLVAGGGIGGLACSLAASRSAHKVTLLEQSAVFSEVGAGIQLGPNVTRILNSWGLADRLREVAAYPSVLEIRSIQHGDVIASKPLGGLIRQRYGGDYITIARADLHGLLLRVLQEEGLVELKLNAGVASVIDQGGSVSVRMVDDSAIETPVVIGADGIWSRVRNAVIQDAPPRVSGHLAFRALVKQSDLKVEQRSQIVTLWMGPDSHVVCYPVRAGEWLNVVAIVHGKVEGDMQSWDHSANAAEIQARHANSCKNLRDLIQSIAAWRLWPLCDRPPMQGAHEHARGRIALLGDAAHPMRPYLAQGAGMAIEDANALSSCLSETEDIPLALNRYAAMRWQRNARVQSTAIRNGEIYHMRGFMQFGRDTALRFIGDKLLELSWLYSR